MRAAAMLGPCAALFAGPAHALEAGDLVISELLIRSVGAREWVELWNPGPEAADLSGCVIEVPGGANAPLDGVTIAAASFAVLVKDGSCAAYDGAGDCSLQAALSYSGITLSDSGDQPLAVRCGAVTIDAVTVDWADLSADCSGASTCSLAVDPLALDAAENDVFPGNYCVTPASAFVFDDLGRESASTPGAENVCPALGPSCQEGDVVLTELMLAPPTSTREWFELVALAPCDLHGCTLREGPFADAFDPPVSAEWTDHVIDAPGNALALQAGQRALMARGADTVVGDPSVDPPGDLVFADYVYGALAFDNDAPGYLHLLCGGVAVDSVPYDWPRFEAQCPSVPCAINLVPAREDAVENDLLSSWCAAPAAPLLRSSDGLSFTGTPGQPGVCRSGAWPGERGLLISEVMTAPPTSDGATFPEWFELWNPGAEDVELGGCRVIRDRFDGDEVILGSQQVFAIGLDGANPRVEAGAGFVLTDGPCLDGSDRPVAGCPDGEGASEGVGFANGEHEGLTLLCPDGAGGEVVVDRAEWWTTRSGARDAHSIAVDPDAADPWSDNDELDRWCEASFEDCYASSADGRCVYGTPFSRDACRSDPPDLLAGQPGCQCSSVSDDETSLMAVAALVISWRRRRS